MIEVTLSPEQDQYLQIRQTRAYYGGLRDGVRRYAYWRDGIEFVGTTGLPLKEAIEDIDAEEADVLEKFQRLLKTWE